MNKFWFKILLFCSIACISLSVYWATVVFSCEMNFDSEVWKSGDLKERGKMVDGLIRNEMLMGKSVAVAKNILGEPDFDDSGSLYY